MSWAEIQPAWLILDRAALVEARRKKRLNQANVAEAINLSQSSFSRIERGYPVLRHIAQKIATTLDLTFDDMVVSHKPKPQNNDVAFGAPLPTEPVPSQKSGPHFAIDADGQISVVPEPNLDSESNDIDRIRQLLPLVKQTAEELEVLLRPQANAFPELYRIIRQYNNAISKTNTSISWGLVWGLGTIVDAHAAAAERLILDRVSPELEDAPKAMLQSLRALHAPLILATSEGRDLQEQSDQSTLTREEQLSLRDTAQNLTRKLVKEDGIVEREAGVIIGEAADAIGHGRQPERGTTFGITTIKHVSIVLISAAAVYAPAHFALGSAAPILTMGFWEVAKKSNVFGSAVAALGGRFNQIFDEGAEKSREIILGLGPFHSFVIKNENSLRAIASSTPQLRWLEAYLDFIVKRTSATDK